jgi:hypothetical protein
MSTFKLKLRARVIITTKSNQQSKSWDGEIKISKFRRDMSHNFNNIHNTNYPQKMTAFLTKKLETKFQT